MSSLFKQLFNFETIETTADRQFHRFLEFAILLLSLKFIWTWTFEIPHLKAVILPAGIANYMDVSQFFDTSFPIIIAVVATGLALLGFLKKWKYAYLFLLFLFHFQYAIRYSQGKMPHGQNLIGFALLSLALGVIFFKKESLSRKFSFGMMVFLTGFSYFAAAISKLIGTGFSWIDGKHLWLWMSEKSIDVYSQYGTFEYNFLQELILNNYYLASATLAFGLVVEFCGLLLWWKKYRPYIGILIIGMHLGIWLTMNIKFDAYLYILVLLSFPWPEWIHHFKYRKKKQFGKP